MRTHVCWSERAWSRMLLVLIVAVPSVHLLLKFLDSLLALCAWYTPHTSGKWLKVSDYYFTVFRFWDTYTLLVRSYIVIFNDGRGFRSFKWSCDTRLTLEKVWHSDLSKGGGVNPSTTRAKTNVVPMHAMVCLLLTNECLKGLKLIT